MNALERWLDANDHYLATELAWLRERLENLARADQLVECAADTPKPSVRLESARPHALVERLFRSGLTREAPVILPHSALEAAADEGAARDQVPPAVSSIVADSLQQPPALVLLTQNLGLTEFERQVLLLCAAMELDTRIPGLCARAQQDAARPFPTFALALALFDQPAWDVLSPERPLRYWRLVEINQLVAQPLISSPLRADERIVNYIKGLSYLDDRLAPLVTRVAAENLPLPPSQSATVQAILCHVKGSQTNARPLVFQLVGPDSLSKLLIAHRAATQLRLTLYRLPAEAVPTRPSDHEDLVRLWQRERALQPIALYVDTTQLERGMSPQTAALQRLASRGMGLTFFDVREPWPAPEAHSVSIDVARPTPVEQHAAWSVALQETATDQPVRLAGQFNFNVPTIFAIAASAQASVATGKSTVAEQLWAAALSHARPALDQLAQSIEPKATWGDIELPPAERDQLRQIADQATNRLQVYDDWGFRSRMNRGLGISVLFTGESGTGKTTAAEVIANELGLLLYRIDLSAVVSKYIGETEKHLRRLFDAADEGGAILLFDEADALFGKRSEVRDSHDRYANIEINYLLQRLESYRGLAILSTNMRSALDGAFLRRLRFVVNFPFPGPSQRLAIWEKILPSATPRTELDFAHLVHLNVTGGSIHNIALNAAFLAAQAGIPVSMPLILESARAEFRKIEKPINETDFRLQEPARGSA